MKIRKAYADTSIGQIHYRYAGEGEPMLLLHQTPTSSEIYEPLMGLIAPYFRTVAVDTPGFGMSAFPPEPYTIPDYTGVLLEVLGALQIETTHVFGHHTGTCLAVELAASAPERVDKLILSGPICLNEEQRGERLKRLPLMELNEDGSYLKKTWDYLSVRQQADSLDLESRHRQLVWRLKAGPRFIDARTAVFRYDLPSRLPLVQSNTLVLRGEEDIMRDTAEPAVRLLKRATLRTIPGAKNWFEYQNHQDVAEHVLAFLRD